MIVEFLKTMKKVSDIIDARSNLLLNGIRCEQLSVFQETSEQLGYILHSLRNDEIKFRIRKNGTKSDTTIGRSSTTHTVGNESKILQEEQIKNQENNSSEENCSENEDSSSYIRSKRAAAQAARQNLFQVQNLMKATKLRRPTDFDEKQSRQNVSAPSAKSRKTRRKQSAGSSHSQDTDDQNDDKENKELENSKEETGLSDVRLQNECSVSMEKLTNSVIKSFTNRSSHRSSLRSKSGDLFDDDIPLASVEQKNINTLSPVLRIELNDAFSKTEPKKHNIKKAKSEKSVKSAQVLDCLQQDDCLRYSITNASPKSEGEFKGFDLENSIDKQKMFRNKSFVCEVSSDSELYLTRSVECKQQIIRKTMCYSKEKEVEVEIKTKKSTVLKQKVNNEKNKDTDLNIAVVESISDAEVNNRISSKKLSCNVTDDVKRDINQESKSGKDQNNFQKCEEVANKKSDDDYDSESPEIFKSSRTRVIKKNNEMENSECNVIKTNEKSDEKSDSNNDSDEPEATLRSRTKVIKKHNVDVPEEECRTRTKTLKKGLVRNDESDSEGLNEQNVQLKGDKTTLRNKGELVRKRVDDYEKMNTGVEKVEEVTSGRVTRHAARIKKIPSSEMQCSKINRNAKVISADRARMTPLGSQNRMTPATDSRILVVNKCLSSATHPVAIESSKALVKKIEEEETQRQKKQNERLRREQKEETAKKKKEKVLKATAEETKRKREEKLKKVAAAREAAEREKQLQAIKAEKEKEEKLKQIAAEKEKQKEEQLLKKQLAQQKVMEHEERRKQEEAARLAKIKEQEEERKRAQALKERGMEHEKQLRIAEAEKAKTLQHGGKLCKLATSNNANFKLQQGKTPASLHPGNSYKITPAREDRPLVAPKSENDYGIDDANSGDSSEDESRPKKKIPLWAEPKNRQPLMMVNSLLPYEIWSLFMEGNSDPDVNQIFAGANIKRRIRTSSAVWNTPPSYFKTK